MAQFAPSDVGKPAREGRARRLLDLYLHQLAADASVRSRLGTEVQARTRRDRRAHPGVRIRNRTSTTSVGPAAAEIEHPVAIDNDYAIWRAFDNSYWPALYLFDARGRVRHRHFGEGEYEQSETVIQRLLAEAGVAGATRASCRSMRTASKCQLTGPTCGLRRTTLDTSGRENFASPGGASEPTSPLCRPRPSGAQSMGPGWRVDDGQSGTLDSAKGRLLHRFHARDLHLVMGPPRKDSVRTLPRDD